MTSDPLIGKQLDEYRLEALLGQGGMARVYRGIDVRLKRYAAIKVIDLQFRAEPDYARRFEHEAQAIAKLEHPHIVRLYRYGEVDGLLYMAMQYIQGSDLGAVLATYKEDGELIEPEDALHVIRQVCLALDYAHDKGIIHRDVKPSNIMLDKEGSIFLTDFGLALLVEVGTRGEIFGSPHYIAPEQAISSAGAVPQSDLYALGVILYEMFTGQLPFDAKDPLDVAMLHISQPPRPPRELRPAISPQVEAVILTSLAKEPGERYASGAALAEALDQALQAAPPLSVSRKTIPECVALELDRHPLPAVPLATPPPPPPPPQPGPAPASQPPAPASRTERGRWPLYATGALGTGAIVTALVCLLAGTFLLSQGMLGPAVVGQATMTVPPKPSLVSASLTPTPADSPAATPTTARLATPSPRPSSPPPASTPTAVLPSPTPANTPTAVPPSPTPGSLTYTLLIAKNGEDSLFVVNQSDVDFPLSPLQLGSSDDDDDGAGLQGDEWGIETLKKDECVAVWKNGGRPKPPPIGSTCSLVGSRLVREKKDIFWKATFEVRYTRAKVGRCEKDQPECLIDIPAR